MASYDSLTDLELRKKLMDFGYDLPVSPQNRDLLINKLKNVTNESQKEKESARRKSTGRTASFAETEVKQSNVVAKTRFSMIQPPTPKRSTGTGRAPTPTAIEVKQQQAKPRPSVRDLPKQPPMPVPEESTGGEDSDDDATVSNYTNEQQQRYTSYLNMFREDTGSTSGIGRMEQSHSNSLTRRGPSTSYRTYSEDESEEEAEVPVSRFKKTRGLMNPVSWMKGLNSKFFKSSAKQNESGGMYSTSAVTLNSYRASPGVGLNNGHARGNSGILVRTKKYLFGDPSESKSNGVRRENENPPPDGAAVISKYLVITLVVFFSVVGLCYFNQINGIQKSGQGASATPGPIAPSPKPTISRTNIGGNYPICGMEGVPNTACIDKSKVKTCRSLFNNLKGELVERAKWKGCSAIEDVVTLDKAKDMLYRLSEFKKQEVDEAYRGMLLLCVENPRWGLTIEGPTETAIQNSSDLNNINIHEATISASGITPYFFCKLWSGLYMVLYYVTVFVLLGFGIYLMFTAVKYVQGRKKIQENEVFELVEQILELLYQQYEKSRETGCEAFLAVNHIRDEMVPPKEKQSKGALWIKAVNYISDNESRIREEIQHISGEEFRVWRWLPGASPLTSQRKSMAAVTNSPAHLVNLTSTSTENKWQGQAFEMSDGGPNSIPVTPTTCLKIRHMWDKNSGSQEEVVQKVEQAILEKCVGSVILHIGVDHTSSDGCVYVRCATKDDARTAYFDLHGWWFDGKGRDQFPPSHFSGHLLSVKFLRDERYFSRFPKSRDRTRRMQLKPQSGL